MSRETDNPFLARLGIARNWPVLAAVLVLSGIGVSCIWVSDRGAGQKQLIFLAVAVGCLAAFQSIDYRIIGRWVWPFFVFSLGLVAYTVVGHVAAWLPGVHQIKGVFAWINLGPISLEPSELVKISFVLVMARYMRFRKTYRTATGLLAPFGLALLPVVLILMQPDLGVAAIFVPTLVVMLFVAGAKVRHIVGVFALGFAFLPVFWYSGQPWVPVLRHAPALMRDYQRDRVTAMLTASSAGDKDKGYQQQHAMMAIGTGGWVGKGFGHIPVGSHVPENHNDMIFSLVGEQYGLLGTTLVIGAFVVLGTAGINIASATKEPFGRLIAVGVVAELGCQSAINLMVCLRMMPVTGVTLPFVSYGGSSLIASYMAAGLLLNVGQNRPITFAPESFEYD